MARPTGAAPTGRIRDPMVGLIEHHGAPPATGTYGRASGSLSAPGPRPRASDHALPPMDQAHRQHRDEAHLVAPWRSFRVSYADRTLTCADCGIEFVHSAADQEFYAQKGFASDPKRCPSCRASRRARASRRGYDVRDIGGPRGYERGDDRPAARVLRRHLLEVRQRRPGPLPAAAGQARLLLRLLPRGPGGLTRGARPAERLVTRSTPVPATGPAFVSFRRYRRNGLPVVVAGPTTTPPDGHAAGTHTCHDRHDRRGPCSRRCPARRRRAARSG